MVGAVVAVGADIDREPGRLLGEVEFVGAEQEQHVRAGQHRSGVKTALARHQAEIKAAHARGQWFEAETLQRLKQHLSRPAPSIVEVGANIGNHVVWYARHLAPSRICPVEPNPAALTLLESNIAANGIGPMIDRRGFGFGAGRGAGRFRVETAAADNLGATRLIPAEDGGVETVTLDEMMGDTPVDFIKIDAEGMEIDVLDGAAQLIARDRPLIWVEVTRGNMMAFVQAWCRRAGYRVIDSTAYIHTVDYFAVPK